MDPNGLWPVTLRILMPLDLYIKKDYSAWLRPYCKTRPLVGKIIFCLCLLSSGVGRQVKVGRVWETSSYYEVFRLHLLEIHLSDKATE